ncbi:MAG: Ig-like domain-containing protein, partial [Phycisphaerae bacterium]
MNKNSKLKASFMPALSAVRQTVAMALVMGTALCAWSPLASAQFGCTPTVALTSPTEGQTLAAPAVFTLAATVGTCSVSKVEFRANGILLQTDTSEPYSYAWLNVPAGTYAITATAVKFSGSVVSSAVNVTVTGDAGGGGGGNVAPMVSMTAPTSGGSAPAPASVTLEAVAADNDGTIQSVQFWSNGVLVDTVFQSGPSGGSGNGCGAGCYLTQLSGLPEGSYVFKAVATDNAGAASTSADVTFTVTPQVTISVARTYVYDEYERLCKTINPESGATVIDYDAAGNIAWTAEGTTLTTSQCNRGSVTEGQKTYRTYDARNRLIAVSTPGGTADVTTTYHADGAVESLTAANPGGHNVTTTYSYNKRRLLTSETSSNGATLYTLGYGYNANGHLGAITYPDAQTVSYLPDALGRATKVGVTGGTTYASAISYFPNGAISGFTYGNGAVHTMTQNTRRLPTRSRDVKGVNVILDDTYAFDGNGNVTDITDQAQAGKTTRGMGYDGLDRLTAAVSPGQWGNATYTYDAI